MVCKHQTTVRRDIANTILVIIALFVIREVVCWFFKTNDSDRVGDIIDILHRNGMQ